MMKKRAGHYFRPITQNDRSWVSGLLAK